MCFNHLPEDRLTAEQQQLLLNVESHSLTLIEGREDLVFNPSQLHREFLTNVIIDDRDLQWGTRGESHYEALLADLRHQREIVLGQIQAIKDEQTRQLCDQADNIRQDAQIPQGIEPPYQISDTAENGDVPAEQPQDQIADVGYDELQDLINDIDDLIININNGTFNVTESPLGYYCPADKTIYLFINNITRYAAITGISVDDVLAYVYIHEMFHAFFDNVAGISGNHYLREIEEPMAECGALLYLRESGFTDIYNVAYQKIQSSQSGYPSAYGFGLYLYIQSGKSASVILGEYAFKANRLDHNSTDIIRYVIGVRKGYCTSAMANEFERLHFALLVMQILNVSQNQTLSFEHLFEQAKVEIKRSLLEKWEPKGRTIDQVYRVQIESIIDKTVSDSIIVESMSPWQGAKPIYAGGTDYTRIIKPEMLKFLPYQHQVKAWSSLIENASPYKSMVITTGTGSGKTESFMAPLITDIAGNQPGLKAIFLYPLNALMEDQKNKLSDMIDKSGADLTFAVYNGTTPEGDNSNEITAALSNALPHELVYREQIRGKRWDGANGNGWVAGGRIPDIILTNPTMLEYMLLRKADEPIIRSSQGLLSWFVIDETHTYSGAGADELAMLIRRVLKAFGIASADNIHFATSSATVGDSDDKLMDFISGVTGQNPSLIDIIKGKRSVPSFSLARTNNPDDKSSLLAKLATKDYLYLDELIPYEPDTISRLRELDRLSEGGLKVKVHFFAEALTNGLYANLEDAIQGTFVLKTDIPLDNNTYQLDKRYMKVYRCSDCGRLMLGVDYQQAGPLYAYSRSWNPMGFVAKDDDYTLTPPANVIPCNINSNNQLQVLNNTRGQFLLALDQTCPCCGEDRIKPFNVTTASTLRAIMPTLLMEAKQNGNTHPYCGRQLISFTDSRRGAAENSLEQNLETERHWVISFILKYLNNHQFINDELRRRRNLAENNRNRQERNRLNDELDLLQDAIDANNNTIIQQIAARNGITRQLTWQRTLELLFIDPDCDKLAACFAKEKDWDTSGSLKPEFKRSYVLGALYNVMKSRLKHGFSPESYGIFKVDYANLDNLNPINQIAEVQALNNELNMRSLSPLTDQNWRELLKIYLDFHVRTNGGLFYKSTAGNGWETLDIDNCRNLKTEHDKRRSIIYPWQTEGVHKKLLWRLFNCDSLNQLTALSPSLPTVVDGVCMALWRELERVGLVEQGQTYYKAYGDSNPDWQDDAPDTDTRRSNFRLNLDKLSFCLMDEAYEDKNVKAILDTTFMGHSPYQSEFCKFGNLPRLIRHWNPAYLCNSNEIINFYKNNSVNYLMCRQVEDIYTAKSIFIQYEHTAQVGRELTKARIEDFKDHDINILACSTTMEMGVDIGELEIVSMSNVPPHPANYKQRAGRAGRAFQNKSTCVTVCNSDAVGLAVMDNPRHNMLERGVMTPTANLNSPQVVQRHINSYLLREFLISPQNPIANRSIKNYWILDFFIDHAYDVPNRSNYWKELMNGNTVIYPNAYAPVFHVNSLYELFETWLMNLSHTDIGIWSDLDRIKNNTVLSGANNASLISATLDALHELFNSVASELKVIQQKTVAPNALVFNHGSLTGYEKRLNYDFMSILCENLLEYCSTHQFTPNANMPVNIVSLKIHDGNRQYDYDNPSRDLVIALSEYAPGQSVTIDGKSFVVAGVDWDRSKAFRSVHQCRDCNYVWMGQGGGSCPSCGSTNVNSHNMIEPTSFLVESETSRMIDKDRSLAHVDAYLVGTNGLRFNSLTTLCEYDTEDPQATTQIIYANNGIGFGFCVCSEFECGRSVAETQNERSGDNQYLRDLMYHERKIKKNNITQINPNDPNTYTTVYEHQNLQRDQRDQFNTQHLNRNMLIGGSIQTNFSILKTYHWENGTKTTFGTQQNDKAILTTLGLLVCEELAMEIPCQRQDIDFLITTLNQGQIALCIYDTAKGGAGYSSKLDANTWKLMLGRCCHRLWDIITGLKGIDSMFSRMTMRYIEKINILETYKWLLEEFNSRALVPAAITAAYPGATKSSLIDIKNALAGVIDATLFVQSNINNWNYELQNATVPSWKGTRSSFRLNGNEKIELAFCGDPGIIPAEASDMIKHPEDWAKFGVTAAVDNGIYPLAFADGWLYITDDPTTANFNGLWASGRIYAIQTRKPDVNQFTPIISSYNEFLIAPNTQLASSKGLLDLLIRLDGSNQIKQFIGNAQGHPLEFCYMDEHLKNQLGAIMVIQLIDTFIHKTNCDINNSKILFVNEEFYDNYDYAFTDTYRRLTDALQSHADCKDMIDDLLNNMRWDYSIDTKARKALPHWRSLVIRDLVNGTTLTLKPHGGVVNGWYIDTSVTRRQGVFFSVNNTNASSEIPLRSDDTNQILYTVSLK